jgi:acetyl-CoA carboxylase biotin carboxyl carrier protein
MAVIDDHEDHDDHARDTRPAEVEGDDYAALVRGLTRDLEGTAITRLELRQGDLRVALRRAPGAVATTVPSTVAAVEDMGRPAGWRAVVAPLTGIFYARPSPDEELYVRVGGHVEADSIVGLIETMKMFNEVTADITGTVREAAVESGALVEAGQPLLYVELGESQAGPAAGA